MLLFVDGLVDAAEEVDTAAAAVDEAGVGEVDEVEETTLDEEEATVADLRKTLHDQHSVLKLGGRNWRAETHDFSTVAHWT